MYYLEFSFFNFIEENFKMTCQTCHKSPGKRTQSPGNKNQISSVVIERLSHVCFDDSDLVFAQDELL